MLIVGINAYHGDASAAAIVDGRLVAAAEEERFNRIKHAAGFPVEALKYVVSAAGASPRDIDILAVARDPWARIMRKAWYALKMPSAARDRLSAQSRFASIGAEAARALGVGESSIPVRRVEHHRAHLASSFLSRHSTRRRCFRSTGWATSPARCGVWGAAVRFRRWAR